ncbi:phosphotransferase family protein [Chiayiivirga flava]|uniref:Aminoglycoside phosphotransferase (APT) family kinase protein n=1 Tax=Chiayiivirga flava TaxID=659595 RepID=A0A7W8D3C0_9GAMM|nr:phosphotransferase family protein [Chiayiivirga flava]MBB5207175.1 aminoglycoside phosphotransferase (APT) family kinase protein [Chiayiivirga flava]
MHPIDEATAVRRGEELDTTALEAWLLARLPGTHGPLRVAQFPSGFSNLTYLLTLGDLELVLRRAPRGAAARGGHDMGREHRLLSALHPVYPKAPEALAWCEDAAVIGAPFYVMRRVRGVVLRGRVPPGLALDADGFAALSDGFVRELATLHAVDPVAGGLLDFGHGEGYGRRQIEGWTQRYAAARTDDSPDLSPLSEWLAAHLPAENPALLIHNDFKYDNVLLDPETPSRILAVLDWEMATIGDPDYDLGTTLAYWAEPGDPGNLARFGTTHLPGNLDRAGVIAVYERHSGRRVGDPVFLFAYGLFKLAGIMQQIYARYRRGSTDDPRFAGLVHLVRDCGDLAQRAIARDRISALGD